MQFKHSNHCKQSKQHYRLNICRLFVEVDKYSVSDNNVPITTLLWEPCPSERNEGSWIRQSSDTLLLFSSIHQSANLDFDIYFKQRPKLSEQSLPHQMSKTQKVKVGAVLPPLLLSFVYLFCQFTMFQSLVKRHWWGSDCSESFGTFSN